MTWLRQHARYVHLARASALAGRGSKPARRWTMLLGTGSIIVTIAILSSRNDIEPMSLLSRRFVLHAEAGAQNRFGGLSAQSRQDPETAILHPLSMQVGDSEKSLQLVGVGVRKVSFLRVKVYSAAFYMNDTAVHNLQQMAEEECSNPSSTSGTEHMISEKVMGDVLDGGAHCAIRIVPVRNTDFSHLRDGFTRALLARQKLGRAMRSLSEVDDQRINASIQAFKSLFPAQNVPKGRSLTLIRSPASLSVLYEGSNLGTVNDPWVAKELVMAYFADTDVISPKLKEDVSRGLGNSSGH